MVCITLTLETAVQQETKSLKKITINEFLVPGFVFGVWNRVLNESGIDSIFSNLVKYIKLSYKYSLCIPPVPLFLSLFTNCCNYPVKD